jgi:hypothetical protein
MDDSAGVKGEAEVRAAFELVSGTRRAAVSRQRLLIESGYFRALFQHGWSDSATTHELHGLPEAGFDVVCKFFSDPDPVLGSDRLGLASVEDVMLALNAAVYLDSPLLFEYAIAAAAVDRAPGPDRVALVRFLAQVDPTFSVEGSSPLSLMDAAVRHVMSDMPRSVAAQCLVEATLEQVRPFSSTIYDRPVRKF